MSTSTPENPAAVSGLRGAEIVATCPGQDSQAVRGVVERVTAGVVRLGLLPADASTFHDWPAGAAVRCALLDGRVLAGFVVTCIGNTLWIRLGGRGPGRAERRTDRRRVVNVPVAYRHDDHMGIGLATDLSPGGLRLRTGEELAPNTRLVLRFRLPDGTCQVEVDAVSLWSRPDPEEESTIVTGVKFVGLSPELSMRIRRAAVC